MSRDSCFFFDQKNYRRPLPRRTKKYIDETPYLSRPDSAIYRLRRKSALPNVHNQRKQSKSRRKTPSHVEKPFRIEGGTDTSLRFDFDKEWNDIEKSFRAPNEDEPASPEGACEKPISHRHDLKSEAARALTASRVQILVEAEKEIDRDEDYREQYNFDEAKFAATGILQQLSKVLYLTEIETSDDLPDNLQVSLRARYPSLIEETRVVRRKWQTTSYRAMSSMRKRRVSPATRTNADFVALPTIETRRKSSGGGVAMTLRDSIFELDATPSEVDVVKAKHGGEAGNGPGILAYNRESKMAGIGDNVGKRPGFNPRTRLERYKVYAQADRDEKAADALKKVSVGPHERHEEILKDFRDATLRGPLQTINFSLCSKIAVERGWVLEPGDTIDPERKTMIEWLKGRSKKLQKERESERKEAEQMGHTEPLEIRHYPPPKLDSARAKFERRMQRARTQRLGVTLPSEEERLNDEKWLICQLPDGTRITYYPSGQTAICSTRAGAGRGGLYTYVYDLDEEGIMLGTFLPSGQGFCYYKTGNLRLAMDKDGGVLHDEDGFITRRWKWPKDDTKLQPSVTIELNDFVQLRCLGKTAITLFFTCSGEIVKYQVPAVPKKSFSVKLQADSLKTNLPFTSRTAQEMYMEAFQATQNSNQGRRRSRSKKSSITAPRVNIIKPEEGVPTQLPSVGEDVEIAPRLPDEAAEMELNDAQDSEKDLETMQTAVKLLVDDWMSHYRTTLGIKARSSPRSSPARDLASSSSPSRQRPPSADGASRPVTRLTATPADTRGAKDLSTAVRIRLGCDSVIRPDETGIGDMLERIYYSRNKNRIKPCSTDLFRIVRYDIACAAEGGDVPMLRKRHNAVPGMIFIYQDAKLLFANRIFNGYSSMKKDFLKQVNKSAEDFQKGRFLPSNFRFGQDRSRSRSLEKAWVSPGSVDRLSEAPKLKSPTSPRGELPFERAHSALTFITKSLSSERQLFGIHASLGTSRAKAQSPSNA
ncbi:uncharacterized protein [Oscarella lobularis]|uniref:uncharacterized protein isoform X2 n=1 Tax=Oscarella lobularis TaxID=121494 RepID=UPI00331422E4